MNFSFSDVKTSIDKSVGGGGIGGHFDRNMMVLYTDVARHPLERVPQESDEDEDLFTSKQPFNYSKSNTKPKHSPTLH